MTRLTPPTSAPVSFAAAGTTPAAGTSPGGAPVRGKLRTPAPDAPQRGAAVLCHPHPAFGGNMDVWLLPLLGETLAAAGWLVLRFDFRSVEGGVQPGSHERERADLAGAIDYLHDEGRVAAGSRLALIGWSFGALVALLHGVGDARVTDWVGIAPPTVPLAELPMAAVPEQRVASWTARRVVIVGSHDQFFPPAQVSVLRPHVTHVLEHCDHFFFDRDRDVARLVVESLSSAEPGTASRT